MKTAKAHRKFAIYSGFLDTILEGEDEIQDGETRSEVLKRILKELEETAAELKKDAESMRGEIIHETIQGARDSFPPIGGGIPPVIDLQDEKISIAIENAQSIEQLGLLKSELKEKHLPLYKQRLKQLQAK